MPLFEMEDEDGHMRIRNELTGNWMYNKYTPDGGDKWALEAETP